MKRQALHIKHIIPGNNSRILLVFLVLFFATFITLHGQTCCSGGVPLGGSLGLGAADSKSLELLFTYDYNALNHLLHVSERLDYDTRTRTTHSGILELNYGINKRFSLTTVLPVIRQSRSIAGYEGSEDFIVVQGLGDIVFLLKHRIIVFPSSGGQWVYTTPGVNIHFMNGISFRLSSEWPLYRKLEGTQLTTGYKFTAALSATIQTRKKESLIFQK